MKRPNIFSILLLLTLALGTINLWQSDNGAIVTVSAASAVRPNLAGAWNRTGDNEKICSIIQSGDELLFVNESKGKSKGRFESDGVVIAIDWEGGLRGRITNNGTRINWANNTAWERHEAPDDVPRISGTWYSGGKECSISQSGIRLRLINEHDQTTRGYFLTSTRFETTDWPDKPLRATVSGDGKEIRWDNGSVWTKNKK